MRRSTLRLALTVALALPLVGCTQAPPPAAESTKASTVLPEGVTKTGKGAIKGKITEKVRRAGVAGIDE